LQAIQNSKNDPIQNIRAFLTTNLQIN